MSSAWSEITWKRHLVNGIGFPQQTVTPLHAEITMIQTAVNPVFHKRIKHLEVDCDCI